MDNPKTKKRSFFFINGTSFYFITLFIHIDLWASSTCRAAGNFFFDRVLNNGPLFVVMSLTILALILTVLFLLFNLKRRNQLAKDSQQVCTSLEREIENRTSDLKSSYEKLQQEILTRKEAEGALQDLQALLLAAIEQSPSGIIIANAPDGNIHMANSAALNIRGETSMPLTDITFEQHPESWQIFHPDGMLFKAADLPLSQAIHKGVVSENVEIVIRQKNGTERWILGNAAPVRNEKDEIVAGVFIFPDITQLKTAEEALIESEGLFRNAFYTSPDAICISRMEDNHYVDVNEGFISLTGYTRNEVIDKKMEGIQIYQQSEDYTRLIELIEQFDQVINFETQIQHKNGNIKTCLISANRIFLNKQQHMISIIRDIDEWKQAESALYESEKKYMAVIETTATGFVILDTKGTVLDANAEYARLSGHSKPEDIIGRNMAEWVADYDIERNDREMQKCSHKGFIRDFEVDYRADENNFIPVEINATLVETKTGSQIICICREITQRKKAETEKRALQAQLLHAQKMEAVGTLAGGMAHDLNNIFQMISGYCQLLQLDKTDTDEDSDSLKAIERAIKSASKLTRQLLTFSRKFESKLRPTDLNQEIETVHNLLERTLPKMIRLELHLADQLNLINADVVQLEQLLMNLLLNATHAMPDGGTILFESQNVTLDQEFCKAHMDINPGNYVKLTISDSGLGMDRQTLDHIFEPFFTTKEKGKGTGLGLSMVYGIVKSHKGLILCESELNRGTSFSIYFPVFSATEEHRDNRFRKDSTIPSGNETIMIVDDEVAVFEVCSKFMGRFGYKTVPAQTGEAALALYTDEPDRYDMIMLDLNMPGMGGYKCLAELQKLNPHIKVLISSGYLPDGKIKYMIDAGAKGYISKPFQFSDILKKIRRILDTP